MIRKLTPGDRETYLQLADEFYHSSAVLHPVPAEHCVRAFEEMMRSEDYLCGYLFEEDGEIAGYAQLSRSYSQEAGGTVVWVEEIYVRPEFRGAGLGRALLRMLPELAPAARYRLEIEPDNARAEKLYREMGFDLLPYRQMVREMRS